VWLTAYRYPLETKGRREKQNDESDVHLFAAALKKSSYLLHFIFNFIFIFYRNKGSSKTRTHFFPRKNPSGLITKNAAFFSSVFFFLTLGCFVRFFFHRVFGRFVTRGVQKRD
jgi:hypothetical protein